MMNLRHKMLRILEESAFSVRNLNRSICTNDFIFEPAKSERYDEIMDHIHRVSYFDVPFYKATSIKEVNRLHYNPESDQVYYDCLKEGTSTVALGKIAGIMINSTLSTDVISKRYEILRKSTNEEFKKAEYMSLKMFSEVDIFNRLLIYINKALEIRLLSIAREYRRTGLAKIFVFDRVYDICRQHNYPLIIGEIMNDIIWKLLKTKGCVTLAKMAYSDYIEEATGNPVYKVEPPNHILRLGGIIVDNKCQNNDPSPIPDLKFMYPKTNRQIQ